MEDGQLYSVAAKLQHWQVKQGHQCNRSLYNAFSLSRLNQDAGMSLAQEIST